MKNVIIEYKNNSVSRIDNAIDVKYGGGFVWIYTPTREYAYNKDCVRKIIVYSVEGDKHEHEAD